MGKAVGRGKIPPPQAWKDPVTRAVENIDVPIWELVEIAERQVEYPVTHPPPPPGSGVRRAVYPIPPDMR